MIKLRLRKNARVFIESTFREIQYAFMVAECREENMIQQE